MLKLFGIGRGTEDMADTNFSVVKDFGGFGDGKWQFHLALVKWFDNEPKYDVRAWNEDMSKCAKGITLSKEDLYDLYNLIGDALELNE